MGATLLTNPRLRFLPTLGTRQKLRHVLIVNRRLSQRVRVDGPPYRSPIPAIVANRHIDAMIDKELCRVIVPSDGTLMQNAGRFMRAPVGIDVGPAFHQEAGNL